ncbi:Rid family hydrolase [Psychrobacter sp. 16-MNA-CIBAN-0192]|uniref:RidA family protein n=1 Tax=Psychrobacter sp. 16-MNA-CIBAN-0192 TaxID=3140448 RepID=UPI00332FA962
MSTYTNKLISAFSSALLTGACLFTVTVSANAAVSPDADTVAITHKNAKVSKSKPIFYGDGGAYPFSDAVRVGDTLYLSGQIGFKNDKLVKGGVKAETKQIFDNIQAILLQYGYQKSNLIKCSAMLTDMKDFADFNKVYQTELAKPYPVRSTFGVAGLAAGASVEIECIAAK